MVSELHEWNGLEGIEKMNSKVVAIDGETLFTGGNAADMILLSGDGEGRFVVTNHREQLLFTSTIRSLGLQHHWE